MKRTGTDRLVRIVLIFFAAIGAVPAVLLILASLSSGWSWPDIIPQKFSLRAWRYIFSSDSIFAVITTLKISVAVIVIDLILALPAANALGRYSFRFKRIISALLMAPLIMPPLAISMGLHKTFIRMGLTENIWGVVAASIFPTLPYMIRALAAGYENIGRRWGEQAKMLGAGAFSRFSCDCCRIEHSASCFNEPVHNSTTHRRWNREDSYCSDVPLHKRRGQRHRVRIFNNICSSFACAFVFNGYFHKKAL